jgi:hypothetical protein
MRCYSPPPKRNLIPRFRKRGTRNDERCINQVARRISGIRTVERRGSSRSSVPLFLVGHARWKRTFSNSNIKDDITHWGENFQTDLILDAIGDDILLDNRTGWIHNGMGENIHAWRRTDNTILVLERP